MNMQAISMDSADSDHYDNPWQQSDWIGDQISLELVSMISGQDPLY